jgi:magnesium-transporting ATPase (P-type)
MSEPARTPTPSWHATIASEVVRLEETNPGNGLSRQEAVHRLNQHGPNELPKVRQQSLSLLVARQFASPLIYLLFLAAGIAFSLGRRNDGIVILFVVVLNAAIGTILEGRATRSVEALRRLSLLRARVVRENSEAVVIARDLVPGDILLLSAGDEVGTDARLLEAAALEIAEAALTGESLPVAKRDGELPEEVPIAERNNMERQEGNEMHRGPTARKAVLFTRLMLYRLALMGTVSALVTLGFYASRLRTTYSFDLIRTETFTLVVLCQWLNVLSCRSETVSAFSLTLLKNRWLIGGLLLGATLQFLAIYFAPLSRVLHTLPIPLSHLALLAGLASTVLWAEECRKWLARGRETVFHPSG